MVVDANKHRVLCCPDLHSPYHNNDALDFLSDVAKEFKPTKIIQLGDFFDGHAFSVHPKEPDLYGPGHEFDEAKKFMKDFYKLFPNVQVCYGNHDMRISRVAKAAGVPARMLLDYKRLFEMPDTWRLADHWIIDGVRYMHGEGSTGRNATWKLMQDYRSSIVHGHIHSFSQTLYSKNEKDLIFGMNCGCLVDLDSLAFAYGAKYANKGVLGCGVVIEGQSAYFVKMPTQ